jgi:uncharacterized protein
VAAFTTLYTNPFTIAPLYLPAYETGMQVTGSSGGTKTIPAFPDVHWHGAFTQAGTWLMALGTPLLIGLPLLATGLALVCTVEMARAPQMIPLKKSREMPLQLRSG